MGFCIYIETTELTIEITWTLLYIICVYQLAMYDLKLYDLLTSSVQKYPK